MFVSLRKAGLGWLLLLTAACQQKPAPPSAAAQAPAAAPQTPATTAAPVAAPSSAALATPPDTALVRRIQQPRLGDVYVVAYQPGGARERYFFYRVSRATPTEVDLLPARQESSDPEADVSAAGFFTDKALTYTRAEALELLQEQPGDVQHTRLVGVRRGN